MKKKLKFWSEITTVLLIVIAGEIIHHLVWDVYSPPRSQGDWYSFMADCIFTLIITIVFYLRLKRGTAIFYGLLIGILIIIPIQYTHYPIRSVFLYKLSMIILIPSLMVWEFNKNFRRKRNLKVLRLTLNDLKEVNYNSTINYDTPLEIKEFKVNDKIECRKFMNIGETLSIKKIYESSEDNDKGIFLSNKKHDFLFLISLKKQKAYIKYFEKQKDEKIRIAIENNILRSLLEPMP